jgi:hypothetical protein
MKDAKLEAVRAKIIEAVPEIEDWQYQEGPGGSLGGAKVARPITLEDVLRAMNEYESAIPLLLHYGKPILHLGTEMVEWHLGKPLDEQSVETIEFLGNVLGV